MSNCKKNENSLVSITSFYKNCEDKGRGDCGCGGGKTNKICYAGPALNCLEVQTGESLDDVFSKVNAKVCEITGDFSAYNTACLNDIITITSEKIFVETISNYVCTLNSNFSTFTSTTFPDYQAAVNNRFGLLEQPNITCSSAGVVLNDSLKTVLQKYCAAITNLTSQVNVSSANWSSCFSVIPAPTTVVDGFNALISKICTLEGSGITLPTFNNTGTCLPAPLTATDSLEDTVIKMRTVLCTTPTLNINNLTWGCIAKPSNVATDLQGTLSAILSRLNTVIQNMPSFSGDFSVSLLDPNDACQGKVISLSPNSLPDRLVAVNNTDSSPGTLSQKLQAGVGIQIDAVTVPGKLVLNSTGGLSTDQLVKTRSADPSAGYLESKIAGSSGASGITIGTSTDTTTEQVVVEASVNFDTLWTLLLEHLDNNPSMKAQFCQRVTSCLPDCIIPPNVTVIYNDNDLTTTSTTTTTTTSG